MKRTPTADQPTPVRRFLSQAPTANFLILFVIASLLVQGLMFLQQAATLLWVARLARKPAPMLVELRDGRSVSVEAQPSLYRSDETIQNFVAQVTTMLFSASGVMNDPLTPKRDLKPKIDPGVELTGSRVGSARKVTTPAWEASFALSESFRPTFLPKLAEITPSGVFSGLAQTSLVISYLGRPEPVGEGQWRVKTIANLYLFVGGNRLGHAVPVNKEVYVRAVYPHLNPLPNSATEIQRAVYEARSAGLEIYRFGELEEVSVKSKVKSKK